MSKEMLINTAAGKECRIAILCNGQLEELYTERDSSASRVGNIYKGRVTNVEAAIQAAFIDFGAAKNGFLHISDVNSQYFPKSEQSNEPVGRKRAHRDRPPIQDCLKRGQEVVVQMTKEGIGTKGPTMTTYLSIPGRLLVMMPGMSKLGVSRKIEDEKIRDELRKTLESLDPPKDTGFIVRTAGIGRTKREMQRDLSYLTRLWKTINKQLNSKKSPLEIYRESDLVTRTLRDVYNSDIDRVICDSESVARQAKEFLDVAMPRTNHRIEVYRGQDGLFHDTGIEQEIERIYSRRVELSSGGSLVIDQTEALVAIDVNSGRFREHSDAETTATKANINAAKEIARQLRLRDMGGVIVIDFIDMREEKNRRAVERTLRDAMKPDRAKTKLLKVSALGLLEMTRQRVRPSLKDNVYQSCPVCEGHGIVKSEESMGLSLIRDLDRAASQEQITDIEVSAPTAVADYVLNSQRHRLVEIERTSGTNIRVCADEDLSGSEVQIHCTNARGASVQWQPSSQKNVSPKDLPVETVEKVLKRLGQETAAVEDLDEDSDDQQDESSEDKPKKKSRRSRRGRRKKKSSGEASADQGSSDNKDGGEDGDSGKGDGAPTGSDSSRDGEGGGSGDASSGKKKSRRGRRGRRKKKSSGDAGDAGGDNQGDSGNTGGPQARKDPSGSQGDDSSSKDSQDSGGGQAGTDGGQGDEESSGKKRSRRSRRPSSKKSTGNGPQSSGEGDGSQGSSGDDAKGGSDGNDRQENERSGGDDRQELQRPQ